MLFFCRDDLKVEIECFVNGRHMTGHEAPPARSEWKYAVSAVTGHDFGHYSHVTGEDPRMSEISATAQYVVEDPESGLDYAVQTALLKDEQTSVYLAFPDGLPPEGRRMIVRGKNNHSVYGEHDIIDGANLMCFCRGTQIRTPSGDVPVETLLPGDMVTTKDNGAQTIRWIGSRSVEGTGAFAPILFEAGTIGNAEELRLSPRHRVLVTDGDGFKLVAAQSLVNDSTIRQENSDKVEYFHIMFDRHEVIFANDAPIESYHPMLACGDASDEEAQAEVLALFPDLISGPDAFDETAYPVESSDEFERASTA